MRLVDPTLKDRELAGLAGMLCWGAPSSVVLILIPLLVGFAAYPPSVLSALIFGLTIGLVVAGVVWAIGGLFVALPVWSALIAAGLSRDLLRPAMIATAAIVVGGIWAWFIHAPMDSFGFWLALGLGALSGALGGYGFCRSAMRS